MSDNLGLGKLITTPQARDAIHIAVAPVVCGCARLNPGQAIRFSRGDCKYVAGTVNKDDVIGIVDPFLKDVVREGQSFWMWLTPGSITSLRHDWTHPAFEDKTEEILDAVSGKKQRAEEWLRQYATEMNHYESPETAFNTLIAGLQSGELFAHGSDLHSFDELDNPELLKEHAETYLGIKIEWGKFSFSCSC